MARESQRLFGSNLTAHNSAHGMSILPPPPAQGPRAGLGLKGELAAQLQEACWGQFQPNRSFTSKGNQFWSHPKGYVATVVDLAAQGVDLDVCMTANKMMATTTTMMTMLMRG